MKTRSKKIVSEQSDSSDEAPEEVGFQESRSANDEENRNITKILKINNESIKQKRRDIQKRNIMQKEEKLKKLKDLQKKCLPKDLLEELEDKKSSKETNETVGDASSVLDVEDKAISAVHGSTQFSVKILPNELRKPNQCSAAASKFKNAMLYRKQIPRETVSKSLANEEKIQLRKNKNKK